MRRHLGHRRIGSAIALGFLTLCCVTIVPPAHALEFQCIESSRYRNLLRIFGEDPEALLTYFRVARTVRPAPDACRAIAVTGTLKDGDARKLLDEIVKSRGWLAALYLSHSGSNRDEEVKVASLIRTFWLKTLHIGRPQSPYEPDFIGRDPAPTSSSTTAWPPAQSTQQPLQAGRDDYLRSIDRKLPDAIGKADCTESCVSFFLAGPDRTTNAPSAASVKALNQPSGDAAQRTRAALQLWLEDTRFDKAAATLPVPVTIATAKRLPRAAAQFLRGECSLEIDANTGAQDQVQSTIDGLAKKNFDPYVRVDLLLPRFDAVHTTTTRLQTCLAGSYDRRRLAVLKQQCGPKCDVDAIHAAANQRAAELIKSWEPDVASATQDKLMPPPQTSVKFPPENSPAPSRSSPAVDAAPR
jgi:hypothetical protein